MIKIKMVRPNSAELKFSYSHGNKLEHKILSYSVEGEVTQREPEKIEGVFGLETLKDQGHNNSVVITNNDFDAMSIFQETSLPSISLSGFTQLGALKKALDKYENVFLWFKPDGPSQLFAGKVISEIGPGKCINIHKPIVNSTKLVMSPNQALQSGHKLKTIVAQAHENILKQRLKVEPRILAFHAIKDHVIQEVLNPKPGVKSQFFPSLNHITKGMRKGEVTVFTGTTGIGKTSFLSQLSLDYCLQGVSTLWGSFEIRHTILAKKMLNQLANKNLSLPDHHSSIQSHVNQFSGLPMSFLDFFGSVEVDQLLETLRYSVLQKGVEYIILDNLQFMMAEAFAKGDINRFDAQDRALYQIRKFANETNVHVAIVIHPRKQDPGTALTLESISGTSKATQEADNVFILQRGNLFNYLQVTKNRYDGELGIIPLKYDRQSGRYSELTREEIDEKAAQASSS